MIITVTTEILGLEHENMSLVDAKPKMMTLSGKGQFSVVISTSTN